VLFENVCLFLESYKVNLTFISCSDTSFVCMCVFFKEILTGNRIGQPVYLRKRDQLVDFHKTWYDLHVSRITPPSYFFNFWHALILSW
jgi:hypothetical protein